MLGLRLAEGVRLSAIATRFGQSSARQILTCLQPYAQHGWVQLIDAENHPVPLANNRISDDQAISTGRLRLSDPEGFLFSNTVLSTLFSALG